MDFMDTGALIETGVISILFVLHAAPWAFSCYAGSCMEMRALKKNQQKCILFL